MTPASRSLWRRRLPVQVLWIFAIACCLAAPLAYLLLDRPVFDWQQQRVFGDFSDLWLSALRLLGKAWLLVWLLLAWVAITGRWQRAYVALLALLILTVPLNSLKLLVGRPRPREKMAAMQATEQPAENTTLRGLSFPSGDTAAAFTVAAALGTSLAWPWAAAGLVAAGGVGVMRVIDLAHHPSDVLAGAALGILAALAAVRLAPHWPPPGVEKWGRPLATLATIGIPITLCFTHGTAAILLLLEIYVPLMLVLSAATRLLTHRRGE